MSEAMTYKGSGVDYDAMDPFKRLCQRHAAATAHNADRLGVKPLEWTRGESAYAYEVDGLILGHVEEGLGTKNLVADKFRKELVEQAARYELAEELRELTGKTYYDQIAQCAVAMIVNDLVTLGILPMTCAMHLAVASGDWFADTERADDLARGWREACRKAGCVWSGGETPTLRDVIVPGAALLSGSATGRAIRGIILNPQAIEPGDSIVFCESNGAHANGYSLARDIAAKLPLGYLTPLADGSLFGEALLRPTHIYVDAVECLLSHGVRLRYAVNITGHGWRKIMRSTKPLEYVIHATPAIQPIFSFIMQNGPVEMKEAFANYNMGAGFALFVHPDDAELAVTLLNRTCPFHSFRAGEVNASEKRRVDIRPLGITFESDSLAVR